MAVLTAPQGYRPGGVWGVCDRCAFKLRHAQLKKEWTGFLVCPDCWDPKPADLDPPVFYAEGLPIRDARPEPPVEIPPVPVIPPPPPDPGGGPPPPPPPPPPSGPAPLSAVFFWMGLT
jgi:hypothetical protein